MSLQKFAKNPHLAGSEARDGARTQYGALCYRIKHGKPEILLITSRGTGRWIVPKGWPVEGKSPADSAAVEAFEEAGVEGTVHPECLGIYSYIKEVEEGPDLPCVVSLYAMRVKRLLGKYPEDHQRNRKWYSRKKAAALVNEPELQHIIIGFDPRRVKH